MGDVLVREVVACVLRAFAVFFALPLPSRDKDSVVYLLVR